MEDRSPFPDWLKRLDPVLARAERGSIYRAFRIRRTEHARSSLLRRLKGSGTGMSLGAAALVLFFVAATVVAIAFVGCLALPLVAIGGIVASTAFQRKRRTEHVMPRRLGEVFARHGFLQDAAVDLWLAGANGRDVLLGIYAEKREGKGVVGAIALGCFYCLFAYLYYGLGKQHHWAGILASAVAFWFFVELWLTVMVTAGGQVRMQVVEPQLFVWEKDGAGAAGELAALRLFRALKGVFVAALVAVPVVVVIVAESLWLSRADRAALPIRPDVVVALTIVFFLAAFAVACRLLRPRTIARTVRDHEELLARADEAFDRFMAGTVVQDPDGAAWARWRHRHARAVAAAPPPLP